jgi:hypothetical protein
LAAAPLLEVLAKEKRLLQLVPAVLSSAFRLPAQADLSRKLKLELALPEKSKFPVRDSGRMIVAQRFIAG